MRLNFLYLVPGLIFLFWAAVHSLLASRTSTFRIIEWSLLTIFVTATGDLMLGQVLHSEAISILVVQLMTPAIIPFNSIYFAHLSGNFKHRPYQTLWVILPAMLFTASLIITSVYGVANINDFLERMHAGYKGDTLFTNGAERTYYAWSVVAFRAVMAVEAVIMIIHSVMLAIKFRFKPTHWVDFLFRNRRMRVLEIQVTLCLIILFTLFLKIILHAPMSGREPAWVTPLVIVISIVDFFFGFFALFSAKEFISIPEIRTAFRFNYNKECAESVAEEVILDMIGELRGESLTHVLSRLEIQAGAENPGRHIGRSKTPTLSTTVLGPNPMSRDEESLLTRFQHLMMDEQLFLQPSLTLSDVSERLHSNKTYVSKMVNRTYNLGFPEVLNILRVDYAEQYIRKHKDSTQDEIARACGFLSASSFNSTFKRITGYTPKVWAARVATNNQ
jgi:AraC-like DNA-binding protein